MKITKLILLDPSSGQGIKRYELDMSTLFSEEYADIRTLIDRLNLLETHDSTNDKIKTGSALTLVIETNEVSKIISIPAQCQFISEGLNELVNIVRGGVRHNNAIPFQKRSS